MLLSDTAVRRPVLAIVGSALLIAFGILSFDRLPLREYPDIDPPILNVITLYPGASAAVVENKITELIEDRLAGLEGIKTMSSTSQDGRSSIVVFVAHSPVHGFDQMVRNCQSKTRATVAGVANNGDGFINIGDTDSAAQKNGNIAVQIVEDRPIEAHAIAAGQI